MRYSVKSLNRFPNHEFRFSIYDSRSRYSELACVDRPCWRQFARIKMKRINAGHSRIEVDIRFQKISQRLRRNIAATRDCDVRVPGTQIGFEARGNCDIAHPLVQLKKMRMPAADADPDHLRPTLCRKRPNANNG